jgi:hypothetical protein
MPLALTRLYQATSTPHRVLCARPCATIKNLPDTVAALRRARKLQ